MHSRATRGLSLAILALLTACSTGSPPVTTVAPEPPPSPRPMPPPPPAAVQILPLPPPPHPVDRAQAQCLALAMYWEAKGEGRIGMRAVGHVVLNRARDERFPDSPCAVVYEGGEGRGCQFSWYCDGRSDEPTESESWQTARSIAQELLAGQLPDTTKGSLFFHARRLKTPWRVKRRKTVTVGNHVFYR
jgi:spore germination cell wall hydrolase CwlJ-like protein